MIIQIHPSKCYPNVLKYKKYVPISSDIIIFTPLASTLCKVFSCLFLPLIFKTKIGVPRLFFLISFERDHADVLCKCKGEVTLTWRGFLGYPKTNTRAQCVDTCVDIKRSDEILCFAKQQHASPL